jgi:hypothetical protein
MFQCSKKLSEKGSVRGFAPHGYFSFSLSGAYAAFERDGKDFSGGLRPPNPALLSFSDSF